MEYVWIIIGVFALIIVVAAVSSLKNGWKLRSRLKYSYGRIPKRRYRGDDLESIASYWETKRKNTSMPYRIDDTTWMDLDMDDVFIRINSACSSVGEEYLYSLLHEPDFQGDGLAEFEKAVTDMDNCDAQRLRLQVLLSRLGKVTSNGVENYLFEPSQQRLGKRLLYDVLAAAAAASVVLTVIRPSVGALLLIAVFVLNIVVYYKTKLALDVKFTSMRYISAMIVCARGILKERKNMPETFAPVMDRLAQCCAPLKKLGGMAGAILSHSSSDLDFLVEYIKIFFMLDFILYDRVISRIIRHQDEFNRLFSLIGFLDAAISTASYRRSVPLFTVPQFTGENDIEMEQMVHPLLENPVANSVTIHNNALITGSNASGKSTFVKAVAVNALLAQTIHTCLAKEFRMMPSFVVTSMAVSDSLEAGESYYIAEIKSLKRVLDQLEGKVRCLCFIDEILKGTNTIERIAASAAILEYLRDKKCLALVATHDIELTEITGPFFDNYHFQEHITEAGIRFDYKIHKGWATTKNAIRLLEFLDYDPSITARANELARDFEKSRTWRVLS